MYRIVTNNSLCRDKYQELIPVDFPGRERGIWMCFLPYGIISRRAGGWKRTR